MALTLLYSDDFTGYANDAAFKAAYPYDPPTNMTSSATVDSTWSSTNGPDGQPGVAHTGTSEGLASIGFDKFPLLPKCKTFRISGRWSFAPVSSDIGKVLTVWWAPSTDRDSDFAGNVVAITCSTTGALTISVKTTAAYANAAAHVYFETIPAAFTPSTGFDLVVDGRISTLVETSPGVFEPNTDGSIAVSVNGTQIFSFAGPVWHNRSDINQYPGYWNGVSILGGKFTDLEIWDSDDCLAITDQSDICSCTPTGDADTVAAGGGQGNGATPMQTVEIGSQIVCAGGGLVPTQPDLVYSEVWWGN